LHLVVTVTLGDTSVLLTDGGKTTSLTVLVDGVDDPVDSGVTADGLVGGVDEDDFEELVGGVLVDPVRVQDAQVGAFAADTFLGGGTEGALVFELVHTLSGGLTEDGTLLDRALTTTTADTDTVDNVPLLGLVTQATSLVGAGGAGSTVDDVQLTVLPAADTKQEADDIRLLLLVEFFQVLVLFVC
jgi:hypothetical protein